MVVRDYTPDDLHALLRAWKRQGFEYAFPDLESPTFALARKVIEVDGEVRGGLMARGTCEMYLLLDPIAGQTPQEKWEMVKRLDRAVADALMEAGLEDQHAFLPPDIAAKFGRRIQELGWVADTTWPCYSRQLRRK